MNKHIYIGFTFITLLMFSCGSSKTIRSGEANYKLSKRQLIKENTKQSFNFETLKGTLKISYTQKNKTQSHSVSFRAKKDEKLWMSATFSVVKALITPEKVCFYNKLDNTYFDGDYAYLSRLLGTELDFEKVQNVLFGETIFNLKDDNYSVSVADGTYALQPKKQRDLFEILFLIDPSLFKVKSQQIKQPEESRHLQIDYLAYQKVDNQILPEKIKVLALEKNEALRIGIEFKNVSLNEKLRFPFKIPSGFKEIEL